MNLRNDVELIYDITHPDGRQERLVHALPFRYLFKFEAEHLLARAGFEVEQLYADYDRSPHGSWQERPLALAARPQADARASRARKHSDFRRRGSIRNRIPPRRFRRR